MKTRRAYIRSIKGLPVETQRRMAEDVGCGAIYEYNEFGKQMDARAAWLNSLRSGDEAWMPDARVLLRTKDELGKTRVSVDVVAALSEIAARGAIAVDARAGLRSDAGRPWANHVEWALQRSHLTHRSQRKINAATKLARDVKAKRSPPGIVAEWTAGKTAKERRAALVVWKSSAFKNWQEARAALPEALRGTSRASLARMFGGRDPKRRGMGGRPKAAGRKR